jgi:hypothetical protein
MAAHLRQNNQLQQINPFLFPADTTFRFILLIVSVIGSSLFIYSVLAFNLGGQTSVGASAALRAELASDPTGQGQPQRSRLRSVPGCGAGV